MSVNPPVAPDKERTVTDQDANQITRVEELSYDIKIAEVMSPKLRWVSPDLSMGDLLEVLRKEHISGAPVVEGDELIGVISLEDLIRAMTKQDLSAPIRQYMTTSVIAVKSYHSLIEAIEQFTKTKLGRFPVLDENGKLVGMITKGDITRGILNALQKDYQAEEVRRYRASHLFQDIISDRTSLILRYHIQANDFIKGGSASSNIKRALVRLGADPQIARRCGIAIYEAEINLIIHTTTGGLIKVEIEPHQIRMEAIDSGPGIPDIRLAMQPGYSTATEQIRELGFGAGMGLVNIKRCVDMMNLESTPGKGTRLEMRILLNKSQKFLENPTAVEGEGL